MVEAKVKRVSEKKLSKLLDLLKDGDSFEREKAMESLLAFPNKNVVERVALLLQRSETNVRMVVLEILKKIGYCSLGTITGLLDDENEDIRVYACEILGDMNDKRAIPYLIKKLSGDNENVRNAACIALGEINDEEAVDALLGALKDSEWIKFSAINSLGKIGSERAIKPLLGVFENDEEEVSLVACEVLVDIGGEEILDKILGILKKWNKKKRGEYIKIILEKENEYIFQTLKEKIGDELFEHLLSVIESEDIKSLNNLKLLANFKNTITCETILKSFKGIDPNEEDYYERLLLFASLKEIWEDNVEGFMNKDEDYLLPLIKASGMENVKIAENVMFSKYLESSIDVKREIVKNIPAIISGKGLSIIKEATKDTDGHIIGDAMTVISGMMLTEMKDEIINVVKKGFFDVRVKALRALKRIDLDNAIEIIKQFVDNGSSEDKKLYLSIASMLNSEQNFPFLEQLLHDLDENIKKMTVSVMGNFLDDERYMVLLTGLLMGENIPHEVLKIIKDRKLNLFQDRLVDIFINNNNGLWTRYYALLALGAFEIPSLFNVFLQGLNDKENLIKIGSLKALSDLNDERALPYIKPFTQSQDEDIRSTAEYAVERFETF
ncbi:MAG: HEAT repeat domain-containing protein [Proteobacteria bacterium]|nr:HEAT repeat domain-containing protein [Pseudomonadota bacterium]